MRIITLFICVIFTLGLTQCSSVDFSRRITQQGNLLPQSKINRLKVGMSKNDVAVLMGTSLLSPMFNNNRWDYAYTWRRGQSTIEKRKVVLYFTNGSLSKIEHNP